jgi:hypothetical protein
MNVFKNIDLIDCKIIVFEVEKRVIFSPCKTKSTNLESSWFKTFALLEVDFLNIKLRN